MRKLQEHLVTRVMVGSNTVVCSKLSSRLQTFQQRTWKPRSMRVSTNLQVWWRLHQVVVLQIHTCMTGMMALMLFLVGLNTIIVMRLRLTTAWGSRRVVEIG